MMWTKDTSDTNHFTVRIVEPLINARAQCTAQLIEHEGKKCCTYGSGKKKTGSVRFQLNCRRTHQMSPRTARCTKVVKFRNSEYLQIHMPWSSVYPQF